MEKIRFLYLSIRLPQACSLPLRHSRMSASSSKSVAGLCGACALARDMRVRFLQIAYSRSCWWCDSKPTAFVVLEVTIMTHEGGEQQTGTALPSGRTGRVLIDFNERFIGLGKWAFRNGYQRGDRNRRLVTKVMFEYVFQGLRGPRPVWAAPYNYRFISRASRLEDATNSEGNES